MTVGTRPAPERGWFTVAEWKRRTFDLPDDHGWSAKPGNNIFVANRGAVLFEYPSGWVLKPDGNSICLYDREAPDDNMRLQVSVLRLGPDRSRWSTGARCRRSPA